MTTASVDVGDERPAVGAVLFDDHGATLLVRRKNPPLQGQWTLVGGRPHAGETLEAAVVREVREETGLDVVTVKLLTVVALAREGFAYRIHEFLCGLAPSAAEKARAGDDALELAWVAVDELEAWGVSPDARAVVAMAVPHRGHARP